MTKIDSTTRQMNFVDSFCTRKLSDDELRLFNVNEGRVRLRDRILDIFSTKVVTPSEFSSKHLQLDKLSKRVTLNDHQKAMAANNLARLLELGSSGPVYQGW